MILAETTPSAVSPKAMWAARNHLPSWLLMRLCYDCGSPFPASSDECPRCGSQIEEPADPLIGAVFTDKYEIEAKLGAGGMCDGYGAMTVERVAGIVNQACAALEAAHTVGVIHRDIKPENIIISEYDGRDWVEVVDFGIAKIQEDVSRRAALTGANLIIGTPRYMSPEQAEEQPVDARSDIYSFGIVVYEMLAGTPPFAGASATRLLIAHAVEPPPPLATQRPD